MLLYKAYVSPTRYKKRLLVDIPADHLRNFNSVTSCWHLKEEEILYFTRLPFWGILPQMRSVSIIHIASSPLFATLQHGLSYLSGPVKCRSNDDFVVEHSQRILRLSRQASYCTSSVRQIRVRVERDFRSM
jgi:hypothetical protein